MLIMELGGFMEGVSQRFDQYVLVLLLKAYILAGRID